MPEESYSSSSSPNGFGPLAPAPENNNVLNLSPLMDCTVLPLLETLVFGLDAKGFPSPVLSPLSGLPKGFEGEPKGLEA